MPAGTSRDKIEARAYEIWVEEGKPHGKHDEHWARAAAELEGASGGKTGAKKSAADGQDGAATAKTTRKAAAPKTTTAKTTTAKTAAPKTAKEPQAKSADSKGATAQFAQADATAPAKAPASKTAAAKAPAAKASDAAAPAAKGKRGATKSKA